MKASKSIPYDFVLEELAPLHPITKPMFGSFGIFIGDKVVMALREREVSPEDNGVWLATKPEHHSSLQKDFPVMRSIKMFGRPVTGWQVLPADDDNFEEAALLACKMIRLKDPRIGNIPKRKLRKAKTISRKVEPKKTVRKAASRKSARKPSTR